MASYGTIHRPSTLSGSAPTQPPQATPSPTHNRRKMTHVPLLQSFNIPPTAQAAVARLARNVRYFGIDYGLFVWLILFVSVTPWRRLSLFLLIENIALACLYVLLLRAVPHYAILRRIIDRRLVLFQLVSTPIVELVLTRATVRLLVLIGIGVLPVFVHAVLRVGDDLCTTEDTAAAGELVPLVRKRAHDHGSSA